MTTKTSINEGATAASVDGRYFQLAGPNHSAFEPGTFVVIHGQDSQKMLGQVDDLTFRIGSPLQGAGRVFGTISDDGRSLDTARFHPFSSARIQTADASTVGLLYDDAAATVTIGSYGSDHTPARLLARRFNRHTFWCGQSGSGKTYALGVVLEQLILHTGLPIVIFDPNADFVRLGDPPEGSDAAGTGLPADRDIRVLRSSPSEGDSLLVRFTDLPLRARGATLHLHPLEDRAEYNELMRLEETVGTLDPVKVVPRLRERGTPAADALAARVENLRVTDWTVWSGPRETAVEVVRDRPDATVLDLGGFAYPDEPLVVAMAVLEDLWARREERRPILIVIDEAHNLCSPDGDSPLQVAVREKIIQIAAEGRKFGLWLLLSTQRPSRIHPSIISQCDNLALMKMASPVDLEGIATIFGFVPAALVARSPQFRQGEALFAGGFVPAPTLVRMGNRLTREGGADISVPLRTP
ncbi:ATP-binding protein [Paenarthrobacter sp. NPDC056912]|uniref:ATP-binding protein n=1 Tax=Paenarthrobacter sp. NPDC056912 TaxID=3345965 RepID=UPI003670490F